MKKIRITGFGRFGLIAFCVLFIGAQLASSVFSAETFQNNLLKADIYKSPVGGLKVVLFTSKPYGDTIIVNKKSDFEYVILMPETSNSMTAKPSLKFVDDVVKGFEVKTQQYSNQVKGYTKIVIATTKPIEINSQVQTLKTTDYKLAENDYKELLSQGLRSKVNLTKKEISKVTKPVSKPASKVVVAKTPTKTVVVKPVKEVKVPIVSKATKQVAKVYPTAQKIEETRVEKPRVEEKAPAVQQTTSSPQVVTEPTAEKIAEQAASQVPSEAAEKKTVEVNNAFTFKNIKSIIKNNFSMLLGFLLALFILLILIARKINRNPDKQKEIFTNHLEERPEPVTNYEENITEDMTWKEKFQTYVETSQQSQKENEVPQTPTASSESPAEPIESNPHLDDLFGSDSVFDEVDEETLDEEFPQEIDEAFINPEFVEERVEAEVEAFGEEEGEEAEPTEDVLEELASDTELNEMIDEEVYGSQSTSLDELFGDEELGELEETAQAEDLEVVEGFEGEIEDELEDQESEEEAEDFVQAEFAIDDEKGFYLVDFEDTTALVGHIVEDIFVLKRFEEKIYGPIHARLNEKKLHSENYMVKVGDFRAMVEVAKEDMNLLIEL